MKKSMLAGLDLPNLQKNDSDTIAGDTQAAGLFIPLKQIQPDPDQPRKMLADADEDLKLLAASILQHGILQPLAVKALPDGTYQIVAGERRWRAAQMALQAGVSCQRKGYDLKRVPVFIINPESDDDKLEMQMVENLARQDMSDLDIGTALQKLLNATRISKAELARRLGRSDTWIKATLAKASPEAVAVAARIGVPLSDIGSGDSMRLISWANDLEKGAVLDAIAAEIQGVAPGTGRAYSRALIDDAEERYEISRRFPKLAGRADLSLDDLQTWQAMWASPNHAQRAVADRVLNGASFADAMHAAAMQAPVVEEQAAASMAAAGGADPAVDGTPAEEAAGASAYSPENDFKIDDAEVDDVSAARRTMSGPDSRHPVFTPEERRAVDVAGLSMESGKGLAPISGGATPDMTVRIPGAVITQLMEASGISEGLTLDAAAVLAAIVSLLP